MIGVLREMHAFPCTRELVASRARGLAEAGGAIGSQSIGNSIWLYASDGLARSRPALKGCGSRPWVSPDFHEAFFVVEVEMSLLDADISEL